jgi:hypothetical protein
VPLRGVPSAAGITRLEHEMAMDSMRFVCDTHRNRDAVLTTYESLEFHENKMKQLSLSASVALRQRNFRYTDVNRMARRLPCLPRHRLGQLARSKQAIAGCPNYAHSELIDYFSLFWTFNLRVPFPRFHQAAKLIRRGHGTAVAL